MKGFTYSVWAERESVSSEAATAVRSLRMVKGFATLKITKNARNNKAGDPVRSLLPSIR
jgi:hypothetical protein